MKGCPKHDPFRRDCGDMRCMRHWSPEGAPTPEEQLSQWAAGESVCPNTKHECCPDFSCCRPKLLWPVEKREKFVAADQGTREKMMMGALTALIGQKLNVHVTRGDPKDEA
jgi:hypothetical protein